MPAPMGGSNDVFAAGKTDVFADGFQPAAHVALGIRTVAKAVINTRHERNYRGNTCADERDGRALARTDFEFIRDEKTNTEAHSRLGKCHKARDREVLAKLRNL